MTKILLASHLLLVLTNLILVKKPISLIIFFAKQCSVIENNSVLRSTNPITDYYLANIEFTKDDIKKII